MGAVISADTYEPDDTTPELALDWLVSVGPVGVAEVQRLWDAGAISHGGVLTAAQSYVR